MLFQHFLILRFPDHSELPHRAHARLFACFVSHSLNSELTPFLCLCFWPVPKMGPHPLPLAAIRTSILSRFGSSFFFFLIQDIKTLRSQLCLHVHSNGSCSNVEKTIKYRVLKFSRRLLISSAHILGKIASREGLCAVGGEAFEGCLHICNRLSSSLPISQNLDQHLFTFPPGYGQFALGVFDESFDFGAGLPSEDNREAENRRERELASRQRYGARQPRGRHVLRRQAGRPEGVPTLEG